MAVWNITCSSLAAMAASPWKHPQVRMACNGSVSAWERDGLSAWQCPHCVQHRQARPAKGALTGTAGAAQNTRPSYSTRQRCLISTAPAEPPASYSPAQRGQQWTPGPPQPARSAAAKQGHVQKLTTCISNWGDAHGRRGGGTRRIGGEAARPVWKCGGRHGHMRSAHGTLCTQRTVRPGWFACQASYACRPRPPPGRQAS